jgi:hypothetical protein
MLCIKDKQETSVGETQLGIKIMKVTNVGKE